MYGNILLEVINMAMIDKDTLYNLYIEKGKTQQEIARMYGCDRKNIAYYLKKYDIKKKHEDIYIKNYKPKPTINEVLKYIDEGYMVGEIAKMYNLGRGTISKILKDNGYNLRNHKGQTQRQSQRMKVDNPFKDQEVKEKAVSNSHKTKNQNYERIRSKFDSDMSFKQYSKIARHIAYYHYGRKTPEGFAIDHMYSVYDGYRNQVPLNIISAPQNLRLVTQKENIDKHKSSIITLKELYKMIE